MLRDASPTQTEESQHDGTHSSGPSSPGSRPKSALDSNQADHRAQTIGLAHDSMLEAERCKRWHDQYQPQTLITEHLTTECARSSFLADQVAEFHQAELEKQAREEQYKWTRRQRRRARYLGINIKTRPTEAVEQLLGFGEGVEFLVDAFLHLVHAVRTVGYLTPPVAARGLEVCGCTQEPAAIGRNPLAYTLVVNNLGCSPGVPTADIDPWLEPVRRPAALRDRPRHELMGADPDECRSRLLTALGAECDRLGALAVRVREDVDVPSLCGALNRVAILNEASARRAARAHTEARVTFTRASNDLVKAIDRERKNGAGPLSSVPGPLSAGNGAGAEAPAEAAVPEETASAVAPVEAGPEGEGAGSAGADCPVPTAADAGPLPARGRDDGFFTGEPENRVDMSTQVQDEAITSVDPWVSGSGCAKLRKTGAQTAPEGAQTGAKTVEASSVSLSPLENHP